ncbi:MAG: NHL repeat-containing protein [Phycisphaerales bacterium]
MRRLIMVCLSAAVGAGSASAATDLLVSSRFSDNVLRYSLDGEFLGVFADGNGMDNPNGVAVGADGLVYVALGDVGRVMRFDASGAYVDDFIEVGSGGLAGGRAMRFGPDGNLYVNSAATDEVLRYDGTTGAFLGVAADGFDGPVGLTFAPNGNLFIGAALTNQAMEFNSSGELVRTYTAPGFGQATGVLVDDDGVLYVAQSVSNSVLRFDTATGAFIDEFISGGLNIPIGMTFMPDGNLLVGSFGRDKATIYDIETGGLVEVLVPNGLGGLDGTHNFAFIPAPGAGLVLLIAAAQGLAPRRRR